MLIFTIEQSATTYFAGFVVYGVGATALAVFLAIYAPQALHWRSSGAWLKRRKQLHGLHHQSGQTGNYGVSTSVWDHVFRSIRSTPVG
jgi:sterol desaturase/sphingolipid hydroxylase (fatty acid hydroxylase superfamily)